MKCAAGFYPDRKITYLYVCNAKGKNEWSDPNPIDGAKLPLPDCLRKNDAIESYHREVDFLCKFSQ